MSEQCDCAKLRAELQAAKAEAAGAASLRLAFYKAAESYPPSFPLSAQCQGWWKTFYDAILDTSAGLTLLAELQTLKENQK